MNNPNIAMNPSPLNTAMNPSPLNPFARQLAGHLSKLDRLAPMRGESAAGDREYADAYRAARVTFGLCCPAATESEIVASLNAAVPALCSRWS